MRTSSPGRQETSFTDNFWANGVEESWVVIWPEHLGSKEFLAGVDLAAFAADYTAITGQPFPCGGAARPDSHADSRPRHPCAAVART